MKHPTLCNFISYFESCEMLFFVAFICLSSCKLRGMFAAEFCNSEVFQPSCLKNEVIFIEKAIYGRKEFGRCLRSEGVATSKYMNDEGFVGCYSDVRHIIETQCAGQPRCEVYVSKIDGDTKCLDFLKEYLDVEFTCFNGKHR